MVMRRYRFVEEGLTIGMPETEVVVAETRRNVKLWNRVDAPTAAGAAAEEKDKADAAQDRRYEEVIARRDELMFPGLAEMLESAGEAHCESCRYRCSYGAEASGRFGGIELCDVCRAEWQTYLDNLEARAEKVFPVLLSKGLTTNGAVLGR